MTIGDRVQIISGESAGEIGTIVADQLLRDLGGVTVRYMCPDPQYGVQPQWQLIGNLKLAVDLQKSMLDELDELLGEYLK